MQKVVVFLLTAFLAASTLHAQLIVTDPAAPTDNQPVTITFDATEGTGGLADCNCDVYLHTGVITTNSTGPSDWQYVTTQWGVANADWRMTPVDGEDNKYTYTFGPSIREYYGVPAGEEIQQIAFVFRNGDGTLEGKGAGGTDIFVDVTAGGQLGLTVAGDPGTDTWPLGKPLTILAGTTVEATIQVFDGETLVAETTGTELTTDVVFTTAGERDVRIVATVGGQQISESFTLDAELTIDLTSPESSILFAEAGQDIQLTGTTYIDSDNTLFVNGMLAGPLATSFDGPITPPDDGDVTVLIRAEYQGEMVTRTFTVFSGGPEVVAAPDVRPGATDADDGVQLLLRAPGKEDVFVIGNFNDWTPTAASRMKRTADGGTFHLLLENLPEGEDLLYQYFIDGEIVQPDPYSTLVLDPNNDQFIGDQTFSGIPPYPASTEGIVTWHRRTRPHFDWQHDDYERVDPEKMVIYELLIRDFLADHSFQSLTDSLDYLERLGVNAIELMPVNEFEGNISWGYNVSFHMALDKYYGSPEDFKTFVDACHERGIAVLLDVVYNHAFGQSPLVRMWLDDNQFRPATDNPYANVTARHPFNVGFDLNHESELTREYVKTTTQYWLEEFHVDGFRFDLSKGFTQRFTGDDVGAWNQYDASRIAIIEDYADHIWSVDPQAIMTMEHLANQPEERELAEYGNGMYFWSGFNPHNDYLEASMGYPNNLRGVLAENRGFSGPNMIAYMESHDEERMQYKNEQFGNIFSADYNVQEQSTGLDRVELASTFFYTVPGPKMLWQFGELGYDFPINYCPNGSVNEGCRTDPKPIRWDYRENANRQAIYNWVADLNYLRNNYDYFHGEVTREELSGEIKVLHIESDDGTAVIVGNFGGTARNLSGILPSSGLWYDYASGERLNHPDVSAPIRLEAGEYRVYLDQEIDRQQDNNIGTAANDREVARLNFSVRPNPTEGDISVAFTATQRGQVQVDLLDVSGRTQRVLFTGAAAGAMNVNGAVGDLPAGIYFVRVTDGIGAGVRRLVVR